MGQVQEENRAWYFHSPAQRLFLLQSNRLQYSEPSLQQQQMLSL